MVSSDSTLIQTIQFIYNATFMPIHLYKGDACLCSFPDSELPIDFVSVYKDNLTKSSKDIDYISTKEFLHVGLVKNEKQNRVIIIGPVSSIALTESDIDSLISSYSLPVDYKETIAEFYNKTPLFTISQFLNILALIHKEVNNKTINVFDEFGFLNKTTEQSVGKHHLDVLVNRKEHSAFHDSYNFEQQYYSYIE